METYDCLRLENQLCFPLYACSREIVRQYTPFLRKLGLTYTQYIALMVLWERRELTVSELGRCLYLDSGTLTPMLKKLEARGFVRRRRSGEDERTVLISVTEEGLALRDPAREVPEQVGACVGLTAEEAQTMYRLCYRILENVTGGQTPCHKA